MLFFTKLPGARWWTLATLAACAVTVWNAAIYFDGSPTPRFLLEKGVWAYEPWWLAAFYFHVVGAVTCLVAGAPLMFENWTKKHPRWHRWLGYIYLNAVLWMAAPAGLALSLVAKGGPWGTAGFAVAGALWWYTTWAGYVAIRGRRLAAHIRHMVRSYALALSAPAFRVLQAGFFLLGLPDDANYLVSLWLSLAVSVVLSESYLLGSGRTMLPRFSFTRSAQGVSP